MNHILIAEDEERIASFLEKGLRAAGYTTTLVRSGPDAYHLTKELQVDLVLLDVGLPGMDGFEVLKQLRAESVAVPVIVLTSRSSVQDTITGLDLGANDYVTKPFTFDELLARIRLRLREVKPAEVADLSHAGVRLDPVRRTLEVDGEQVELSSREFALATEFLSHPGQVLSREQLLSRVWGYDFDPGSNVVDVYVGYLRSKIGGGRIQTVRGMGYRFGTNQ